MRTRDLDQAIDAVTKVYCPHKVTLTDAARQVDVVLEITRPTWQPLVELSYGARVDIDAGNFPRLFLMMHSACGRARASQERNFTEWRQGQTVPFSAGLDTRLWFDTTFVQKSVRVDVDRLEMLCARWLGRPLDQPLRFEMQPFPTSSSGPGNGRWPICGREKKKAWRSPVRQKPHSTSSC